MNKHVAILFCFFGPAQIWSQTVLSATLPAPTVWCQVKYEAKRSQYRWESSADASNTIPVSAEGPLQLNFWPLPVAPALSPSTGIRVPAEVRDRTTVFVVYKPAAPGKESVLWTLNSPDRAPLVCTDKRIADLASLSYLNWEDQGPQWRIATWYQAHKRATTAESAWLQIGKAPAGQSLPVAETPGALAELILFPKVLSPTQRLQVESYLALKYGITLGSEQQPKNYTNSDQQVIWDGALMNKWQHRIFGIGKDTSNHWEQQRSQSVLAPDFLVLGISGAPTLNGKPGLELPSFCYWLTADNNLPLEWTNLGNHQQLKRSWVMQTTGSTQGVPTELRLDLGKWLTQGQTVQDYKLIIDRSGKGTFLPGDIELVSPGNFSKGRFAHFPDIIWDKDGSGKDVYTFIHTKESTAENPETALRLYPNPAKAGQVWQWQFRPLQPSSLELRVRNSAGQLIRTTSFGQADYFSREERPLPAGLYWLEFSYNNQIYSQKFVVQ